MHIIVIIYQKKKKNVITESYLNYFVSTTNNCSRCHVYILNYNLHYIPNIYNKFVIIDPELFLVLYLFYFFFNERFIFTEGFH